MENEYQYFEGDEITSVYFLKEGTCTFVLPKYDNSKYIKVKSGSEFGMEDLVGSIIRNEENIQDDWISHKDQLIRQFTVQCSSDRASLLSLTLGDLHRM